ncbi:CvpA family protein [Gilvimarinus agarilyticus]|uniref:CvpA family protein n=1 Tax=unclassified Gilvimarinus TaxID=2642066 RepID=UPI001C085ABB|nr:MULTISPECIES: CvpA family protein [unclassified Gilvimarinus]MBU2884973.1 CvpA family protein [Gilvimarinus agarilyticus]MDO6569870.1 CvpA family protein [Gilvimarinus sp. 2_MG-2023]MDO6747083.1 CvpA family protein [Gilvimarinus sp. 1_MG-2023]
MGTSAIILLAMTAFFAIRGYFTGTYGSLVRTISFLGAYGAAFYFSKQAAHQVKQNTPLDGILAYIVGGMAVFIVAMVAIRIVFWVLAKMTPGGDRKPSQVSRMGGLVIGGIIGGFIGLLLVYLLGIYTSAKEANAPDYATTAKQADPVDRIAKSAVSKSVGAIMSASGANERNIKLTESFVANPVDSVDRVTRVTQSPDLQSLLKDRRSQRLLKQGDIDELMKVPEFRRLMNDQDMRELMAASGLDVNDEDSARQTAQKIAQGWQRIDAVKNDTRVQKIINDPEFQRKLQADNKLGLLTSPQLNQLAEIIFVETAGSAGVLAGSDNYKIQDVKAGESADYNSDSEGTIYRHVDENGKVQYTDKPVD